MFRNTSIMIRLVLTLQNTRRAILVKLVLNWYQKIFYEALWYKLCTRFEKIIFPSCAGESIDQEQNPSTIEAEDINVTKQEHLVDVLTENFKYVFQDNISTKTKA